MATDFGTMFSTFPYLESITFKRRYLTRTVAPQKPWPESVVKGRGIVARSISRYVFEYPFKTNRVHIKFLPNWPCKVLVLICHKILFHGSSLGAAMMSSNRKNYRSLHQINIFRRTRYLLAPEFSD